MSQSAPLQTAAARVGSCKVGQVVGVSVVAEPGSSPAYMHWPVHPRNALKAWNARRVEQLVASCGWRQAALRALWRRRPPLRAWERSGDPFSSLLSL